ncbi:hypothetical protein HDV04_005121 [Boothiomyces sp. JEL0838]|nr:hypothetical protein HDV04_005121 [Boothiomyces sp. JEL0838]
MLLFQLFQLVNSQAFGSEGNCDTNADCNPTNECLNGVCYPTTFMESPCGFSCGGDGYQCVNNRCQPTAALCDKCKPNFYCVADVCAAKVDRCSSFQDNCNLFTDACGPGAKCVNSQCVNLFVLTWYNFYIPIAIGFFGIGNVLQKVFENAKLKQKWKRKRDELKKKTKDNNQK